MSQCNTSASFGCNKDEKRQELIAALLLNLNSKQNTRNTQTRNPRTEQQEESTES